MKGQYFGQLCAVKSWSFDKSSYACKGWIEYFLYGTLCAGAGGRRQGSTVRYSDSHDWVVSMAHTGGEGGRGTVSPEFHRESPPHHHFLVLSHPRLDLTHGDVVDWGLLPPGPLRDHHLQHQHDYIPAGRHPASPHFGYWLCDEFFSGHKFWHWNSLQIICFMRKDETPPAFIIVRLQIENW